MARVPDPASQQLLFSQIVWEPAFLSRLMEVVVASLPTQEVASLETALQIWTAAVTSSTDAAVTAARDANAASFSLHSESQQPDRPRP